MRPTVARNVAFLAIRFTVFVLIAVAYTYVLPLVLLWQTGLFIVVMGAHFAQVIFVPLVFIASALTDESYYDRWMRTWTQHRPEVAQELKSAFVEPFKIYPELWRWVVDGPAPKI